MKKLAKQNVAQISVVILTFNEERNLPHALRSIEGWSDDIHIVDSGSTDRTLEIARELDTHLHFHSWKNWADQRNWVLDNCPIKYEWILFLDADEQLTLESRNAILLETRNAPEDCLGFYLKFDFYFLGKRLRNAMNPHLRLVRKHGVRWHVHGAREYCTAPAGSPVIQARLTHNDHRGVGFWVQKQLHNAELEGLALYARKHRRTAQVSKRDSPRHRREVLYSLCPPLVRPFVFFAYRLLFKTDIRDGWAGFVYALLFGFWYPLMIDVKYIKLCVSEMQKNAARK